MYADTEVWFRNCFLYVNELVAEHESNVVLDLGYVMKRKVEPAKWMNLKFRNMPWRLMLIGDQTQGVNFYDAEHGGAAQANFPIWMLTDDLDDLEKLATCGYHKYIVLMKPKNYGPLNGAMANHLNNLQLAYPQVNLHMHGLYSYQSMFDNFFRSVDVNARDDAANGKVFLANGKFVLHTDLTSDAQVAEVGMRIADLSEARNRCIHNIRSAKRASTTYKKLYRTSTNPKDFKDLDIYSPDVNFTQVENNRIFLRNNLPVIGGDKLHCDTCTLALDCKFFRKGDVCAVPDSEGSELAKYFGTRNSETIIDGLGKLMQTQADRVTQHMGIETITGKKDDAINKDLKALFDQGVKLAKLIDPTLRSTSQNNVQINLGDGHQNVVSPKQLITQAIRELESQGFTRDQITPAMIQGLLEGMIDPDNQRRAIEGIVVQGEVDR